MSRSLIAALAAAGVATIVPGAAAKEFQPGDLRVCNAHRCVAITNRAVVPLLGRFYYTGPRPATAPAPRLGAPAFELRFRNGYATGIAASAQLDRFLSFGVYIGRFQRGTWYRLPPAIAAELRRLSAGLEPLRVTKAALSRSR